MNLQVVGRLHRMRSGRLTSKPRRKLERGIREYDKRSDYRNQKETPKNERGVDRNTRQFSLHVGGGAKLELGGLEGSQGNGTTTTLMIMITCRSCTNQTDNN